MKLTLGFSPCPNDTFIFDALVNKKIDTQGIDFAVMLEDVQTLNTWALAQKLDVTKISYGVWPLVMENYQLLQSGGALGKGVGPLLIAKNRLDMQDIAGSKIAIPGENTTAHMLFSLAFPSAKNKVFKVFNEIEEAVLYEEADAGVIIHENRFTYRQRGLYKLIDLGDYWETQTQLPIPLGGIVAKKNIDKVIVQKIDALICKSVEYAFKHNYEQLSDYVKLHAREMSEYVMRQHIDLYVNDFSLALGEDGHKAVDKLVQVFKQMNASDKHHLQ